MFSLIKNILKIIFIFSFFFILKVNAELYICDSGDILNNCDSGTKIINIKEVNNFNGNYINSKLGYFGNKFTKDIHKENSVENKVGYLGNKYKEINFSENKNINYLGFIGNRFETLTFKGNASFTPIGNFGNYDNLIFPELNSVEYSGVGALYKITKSKSSNKEKSCPHVTSGVSNITIKFEENDLEKNIILNWENGENFSKIKVMRLFPKMQYFELTGNEFIDDFKKGRDSYSYIVYSYNDCGNFIASKTINIKVDLEKIDNSKLYIFDNTLKFNNSFGSIAELKCNLNGEEILDKTITGDFEYKMLEKYNDKMYSCYVYYFDDKKYIWKNSNVVYNNIFNSNYLTNLETIKLLSGIKDINKQKYYYLNAAFDSKTTYKNFAIIFLNTKTKYNILDKDLSIKIFESMGFYKNIKDYNKIINIIDIQKVISQINLIDDLDEEILSQINNNFELKNSKIISDLNYIYHINKYLKESENKDIISCFTLEGCLKIDEYFNIRNKIKKSKNINLNISEITEITYKKYFKILFKLFLTEHSNEYSDKQIDYFVNILINSLDLGDELNNKIDYFSYERMNLFLINSELQNKLEKLSKYLPEINNLYNNTNNKQNFHGKILEYLNK